MADHRIETASHGTGLATKTAQAHISAQTGISTMPKPGSAEHRLASMPMPEWLTLMEATGSVKTSSGNLKRFEVLIEGSHFRGYIYRLNIKPSAAKDIEALLKGNYLWRQAGCGISFSYTDEYAEIKVTPGESARGEVARLQAYKQAIDRANIFGRALQLKFELGIEGGMSFQMSSPQQQLRKEPKEMPKMGNPHAGEIPVFGVVLNRPTRHHTPNFHPPHAHIDPSFEILRWEKKGKGKGAPKSKIEGPVLGYG